MLIISPECAHVKLNMHNRIVKNHFIRGDHSLSPSSLSLCPNAACQVFLSIEVCVYAYVSVETQRASIHQPEHVSQETHNCVC